MITCKNCGQDKETHAGMFFRDGMWKECKKFEAEDVEITDFNKDMSKEERNYYGKKFDENR